MAEQSAKWPIGQSELKSFSLHARVVQSKAVQSKSFQRHICSGNPFMFLKMMQSAQYETLCICVACAMCIEALSTLAGRLHHKVHSALSTIHPLSKHYAVQPHGSRDAHISPNSPPRPSRRLKMRIVRVFERK